MPAKRALRLEEKENKTPSKRPVPERTCSPLIGAGFLSNAPSPEGHFKARGKAGNLSKTQKAQTDAEKLEALRCKIEGSQEAFIKARRKLENMVPTEGSVELKMFFSRGSADLQSELRRNRELVAQVEGRLKGIGARAHPL